MTLDPYNRAADITPSDSANFAFGNLAVPAISDAIYVGGAGIVAVVFQGGEVVNFTATAGQILPLKAKRVNATNTTATLLRALYRV